MPLPSGEQPQEGLDGRADEDRPSTDSPDDDEDDAADDAAGDVADDTDAEEAPAMTDRPGSRATVLPSARPVECPSPTQTVSSARALERALAAAGPGDVIELADGVFLGKFVATVSGTAEQPIWLCGGRGAVLDGGGIRKGYALHLSAAQHWRVVGFTVRNSQKGVVADATTGTVLQDLLVEEIGDEAIHLRSGSTGSAVLRNTIRRTGLRRDKFGEGVYVGSATSNWSKYSGGGPDRSDYNLVALNDISETAAESVDIKEGTTGGAVVDNTFDGTGMTGGDSWVDVKGNDWLIGRNTGRNTPKDGMQTHRILDGWGTRNVFTANVLDVPGPGLGIYIHDPRDTANRVLCDNRDSAGRPITSTIDCTD
jgi:hypothetical protein